MKRAGEPAGHDFGDNRVPGAGQRVRECLTERPELDNQGTLIMTHRDRAGDPLGHRAGEGGVKPFPSIPDRPRALRGHSFSGAGTRGLRLHS